jgi:hypothetical protein
VVAGKYRIMFYESQAVKVTITVFSRSGTIMYVKEIEYAESLQEDPGGHRRFSPVG